VFSATYIQISLEMKKQHSQMSFAVADNGAAGT